VIEIAIKAGATTINIPDTVGYTAPRESADLIRMLIEKVPGMDVVSIGPQIENAHSPEEKVQISSVQKFYKHLAALLEELA
jgi:acetylornithine deacetylase/succinyl-diaminopimelate desuccinylase-like protein